jgi:hypothetical protein
MKKVKDTLTGTSLRAWTGLQRRASLPNPVLPDDKGEDGRLRLGGKDTLAQEPGGTPCMKLYPEDLPGVPLQDL